MSVFTSCATNIMFRLSSVSTTFASGLVSASSGFEKGCSKQLAMTVGASSRAMISESPNSNCSAASLTNSPLR
jgi:hypothetical protein